jgi:hypothetical protein
MLSILIGMLTFKVSLSLDIAIVVALLNHN